MPRPPTILTRLFAVFALTALFGVVIITGGCGAAPVAQLILFGEVDGWLPGRLLGWGGLLICLASVFRASSSSYLGVLSLGVGVLLSSDVTFCCMSQHRGFSLLFIVPLACAWLLVIILYLRSCFSRP